MKRLKPNEVKAWRDSLLKGQGGKCALCGQDCEPSNAVLDHSHTTHKIRYAIHRGCNSLLGKAENNYKRYGIRDLGLFLTGAAKYIELPESDVYHPSFRTEEEKRLRRNKRARMKRKKAKS